MSYTGYEESEEDQRLQKQKWLRARFNTLQKPKGFVDRFVEETGLQPNIIQLLCNLDNPPKVILQLVELQAIEKFTTRVLAGAVEFDHAGPAAPLIPPTPVKPPVSSTGSGSNILSTGERDRYLRICTRYKLLHKPLDFIKAFCDAAKIPTTDTYNLLDERVLFNHNAVDGELPKFDRIEAALELAEAGKLVPVEAPVAPSVDEVEVCPQASAQHPVASMVSLRSSEESEESAESEYPPGEEPAKAVAPRNPPSTTPPLPPAPPERKLLPIAPTPAMQEHNAAEEKRYKAIAKRYNAITKPNGWVVRFQKLAGVGVNDTFKLHRNQFLGNHNGKYERLEKALTQIETGAVKIEPVPKGRQPKANTPTAARIKPPFGLKGKAPAKVLSKRKVGRKQDFGAMIQALEEEKETLEQEFKTKMTELDNDIATLARLQEKYAA